MRKFIMATSVLFLMFLLSACAPNVQTTDESKNKTETTTKEPKKNKEEVDQEKVKAFIQEQEKMNKELTEEVNYYKQYVKDMAFTMSAEEYQSLIDKEWNYSLTINNVEFPKSGIVEISQRDFELVLKEERVKYSVLPDEESIKGKLKEEIKNSLNIKSDAELQTPVENVQDNTTSIVHSFKAIEPKTTIYLSMSEELAGKLGVDTMELEIRIVD